MNELLPGSFFDLNSSPFATLFAIDQPVWNALDHIDHFIANMLDSKPNQLNTASLPDGVTIVNADRVFLGHDCIIEPGAFIEGPCYIGNNCHIRHAAYLRGHLLFDDGCVVGHASEVKNAIFLKGAKAPHFAYVGDSILGANVNLGAGAKCANLKFDRSPIKIAHNGSLFDTGRKKLGAIVGDRCQIGCNAVLNPGTLLSPDSFWFPCVNAGGYFPPRSKVKKSL